MEKALENNEVLLWGLSPVKKTLLQKFDRGNKNPYSLKRVNAKTQEKEKAETKKPTIKEFNLNESYGIQDLDFLNNEFKRIDKEIENGGDLNLYDLQDKLYELIEGLEHLKRIQGKGFKKGSAEALAHADKMRNARLSKPKKEVIKEVEKDKLITKNKGKPWFYIGDIPKGYREATEDEAIKSLKVSAYGKYQVDTEKYRIYKDFKILLSEDKTNQEIKWNLNGLKKRVLNSIKEIDILKSKLENDKYKDKWDEYKKKLVDEKENKKYLEAGFNWYYKLLCDRLGIVFKRVKFNLEIPDIQTSKPEEKPTYSPIEKQIEKQPEKNKELLFINENGNIIVLSTQYFDDDNTIKSKFIKNLINEKIILQKKHYKTSDYNKYFYKFKDTSIGYGLIGIKAH